MSRVDNIKSLFSKVKDKDKALNAVCDRCSVNKDVVIEVLQNVIKSEQLN